MPIDRRDFLKALTALGASIALPSSPTAAQIDTEWSRLLREPWYFDVDPHGTILESGNGKPATRADVFEDVYVAGIKTVRDLIDQVESCVPLVSHFQSLTADEFEEVQGRLDEDDDIRQQIDDEDDPIEQERLRGGLMPTAERAKLENVAELLADEDDGWQAWVRLGGPTYRPKFIKILEDWLDAPVYWGEQDWFPEDWNDQGKALRFFRGVAADVADEVGVVIVEGEHPGSSYYAAELRADVDAANATAARLQLPFRFRRSAE